MRTRLTILASRPRWPRGLNIPVKQTNSEAAEAESINSLTGQIQPIQYNTSLFCSQTGCDNSGIIRQRAERLQYSCIYKQYIG